MELEDDFTLSAQAYVKKASTNLKLPLNLIKVKDLNLCKTALPSLSVIEPGNMYYNQKSWLKKTSEVLGMHVYKSDKGNLLIG